ncbi:MAG: GAF domain-containing protein [Acidobacteriota bacterium]|nr:GAF domain-containing protein [Acidobacteriota bacterium]
MASKPQARNEHVVNELKETISRATTLLDSLAGEARGEVSVDGDEERIRTLQERLEVAESDLTEISTQLVEAENQRGRLMNLYVATYQLHATLEIEEVTSTIAEIARELIGAEKFVLLLRDEESSAACGVALAQGLEADERSFFGGDRYVGGDAAIDAALEDGSLRTRREPGSCAIAVVPLTVQGSVVGALAVLKLFDHKAALTPEDKDLLDLLAAHAASALLAARVYSATDRRLRTLESLVKLVQ